ncbi:MAG: ATP-binding protein [Kofleriaceae bacterium]
MSTDAEHVRTLAGAPVGLLVLDPEGRIAFANPRAIELVAALRLGDALIDLFDEADRSALHTVLEQAVPAVAVDVRLADHPETWLAVRAGLAHTVTLDDVTERKRFECALSDASDRFEAFMDASTAVGWMKDTSGVYAYANEACAAQHGFAKDELLGKSTRDLVSPERAAAEAAADAVVLETGRPTVTVETSASGRTFQIARFPFWDTNGTRFTAGLGVDISAQRSAEDALERTQEQLRHAQKMEAVGRLAGGIAHDFNNLLTVIVSYTSLSQSRLEPNHEVHIALQEIEAAAHRAAQLTRQLLSFSRRQAIEPHHVNLGELLDETRSMLVRLLGEDVEVAITAARALGPVFADPGCLVQVLLNLAINARDAMPRGGRISIEAYDVGPYVRLSFSDTGEGMDAETQARIFEPFFTTKGPGVGTGLGLAIVFGIVDQAGGTISVRSAVGAGTTFIIDLPRADGAPAPAIEANPTPVPGGTETILVVEDDTPVRVLATAILEARGYRVLVAASPAEALQLAARHRGMIDLVLADVVLPKLSGVELWQRLSADQSGLKVLWMSGYGEESVHRHGLEAALFVNKPFTPSTLARRLRAALDR